MIYPLYEKIKSNPKIYEILKHNSNYIKLLNRDPNSYKIFLKDMKDKYKLRIIIIPKITSLK
jgi:SMC interacting uncharacterized protein involved in chromosome segregation